MEIVFFLAPAFFRLAFTEFMVEYYQGWNFHDLCIITEFCCVAQIGTVGTVIDKIISFSPKKYISVLHDIETIQSVLLIWFYSDLL